MNKLLIVCAVLLLCPCVTLSQPVPDTGQTKCYDNTQEITCPAPGEAFYGQDAQYVYHPQSYTKLDANGGVLPNEAIEWVMVRDNVTGLIWLKDANCFYLPRIWNNALSDANGLADGSCGLTDGSNAGDWRLPNINELASLVQKGYFYPSVPDTAGTGRCSEGDPFINCEDVFYWSSTTVAHNTDLAWSVDMYDGYASFNDKSTTVYHVWPVRGGH